jgi:DNA-binding IclR family transcriptional regulator
LSIERNTYQVRALERGLQILTSFTPERPELSLQELHELLHLDKATLLRLLSVLRRSGFVSADGDAGRYRLGARAFEVGCAYLPSLSLEQVAVPYLRELSKTTMQTANLAVLDRYEVVHIAVIEPDCPLHFHTRVGLRDAPYCTALGKALLANLPPDQIEAYLAQVDLVPRTPATILDPDILRQELAAVRASGFGEDREESIPGLRCLAAPVRSLSGEVVAAISISGPIASYNGRFYHEAQAALRQAAAGISERLGALPPRGQRIEEQEPNKQLA